MYDYLIVGLGLAGLAFCDTLEKHGRSFRVVDDDSQQASRVAGGLYNPVVLKRLKPAWAADRQLPLVAPFYNRLQEKLGITLHYPRPILRRFASAEEQNEWLGALDSPALREYLSPEVVRLNNNSLHAPWGFGAVIDSGRVDTGVLLTAYSRYLVDKGQLDRSSFQYDRLECRGEYFKYDSTKAARVVFATGFGLSQNPYFNYLPIQGNKGEYLEVRSPELKLETAVKGSVFIIPRGGNLYSVGATYDTRDTSPATTDTARTYLLQKLDAMVTSPYSVAGQTAGIRPTVPDRRPLVGVHPEFNGMFALNGFGSRGVMIAPYAAAGLFGFIENSIPLDPEMDIRRYESRYTNAPRP
jgi:glycine oxidase